ncbi:MAG: ATP-binding protein [Clostridiales bacterium]|nr:ATP-binding protein [Clostridiales bacterium]
MFIGREDELRFLEEKYKAPGSQFVVLYGRRRIGKTETLRQFCRGKQHVFFTCRETTDTEQFRSFVMRIRQASSQHTQFDEANRGGYPRSGAGAGADASTGAGAGASTSADTSAGVSAGVSASAGADADASASTDWAAAFRLFVDSIPSATHAKALLVIDEFPNMCKGNPAILPLLRRAWDERMQNANLMIVLSGSALSFVEEILLSAKSPLHGRITGICKMEALPFSEAIRFFPAYTPEEKLLSYAILGGIPHHLQQFDPSLSLNANIINNILTKGCVLFDETEFLLRQDLRETAIYNTIIEAIASGYAQMGDIHAKTQISKSKISVYLKNLIALEVIAREVSLPSGAKNHPASTSGLYSVTDSFLRFWFCLVFHNLSDLESGDIGGVFNYSILPRLDSFASPAFRAACMEFLRKKNARGDLPFRFTHCGPWWGKLDRSATSEIDILASDDEFGNYLACVCQYSHLVMEESAYSQLIEKARVAKAGSFVRYALFSRSGFSAALTDMAEGNENLLLFTLEDIAKREPVLYTQFSL